MSETFKFKRFTKCQNSSGLAGHVSLRKGPSFNNNNNNNNNNYNNKNNNNNNNNKVLVGILLINFCFYKVQSKKTVQNFF